MSNESKAARCKAAMTKCAKSQPGRPTTVRIDGNNNIGVAGDHNQVQIISGGGWRNPHKDRLANRIGLAFVAAFSIGVIAYLWPVNPATLSLASAVLRELLLCLCAGLAIVATACLVWRWRD